MKPVRMCLATLLAVLLSSTVAPAAMLTQGALAIEIRDDNGAIDNAVFAGSNFFKQGAFISDFGFQNGTNDTTFTINTTNGITNQPVSGTNPYSGTYTGGGANVAFVRTYSLVAGLNVLRVTTTFTNNGPNVNLGYFDTFDPDQGIDVGLDFDTFNDVFALAGGTVGQSSADLDGNGNQLTVIAGSVDPRVTVAAGNPFSIGDGSTLNDFFDAPADGNGALADQGLHIGARLPIISGQSTTFTYDLAFGLNPAAAQNAFTQAQNQAPAVVPEPSSMALLAMGSALCWLRARRKTTTAVA